jgi:hypothetical protein
MRLRLKLALVKNYLLSRVLINLLCLVRHSDNQRSGLADILTELPLVVSPFDSV